MDRASYSVSKKTDNKQKSVGEILETLNEEQRNVFNYLLYKALGFSEKANSKDESK